MIDWMGLHQGYLQAGEMEIITMLVRSVEAKTMVEIGCRDGRTARVLLGNVTSLERYIGIDVPMSYVPALAHQRAEMVSDPGHLAADDPRFELIISARGSLDLRGLPPCEAVFIDGDHGEEAVMHDSRLADGAVRSGGIIIWHDASNGAVEVDRVLDRLRSEGWPIETVPGTWLAFCRLN
jgi:predicted O-methyltransferase YrrM